MKKPLTVLFLLLLAGVLVLPAQEAPASKIFLGLGGGIAMPMNSGLSENYGSAFHFGGTLNIALKPSLWLFFDARVHSMGIKSGAYDFPPSATLTGGGASIFSLIGGAKYFFTETGPVRFYVFAGIGLNSNSYKDVTGQWTVVTPGYTATISRTESFDSDGGFGILVGPGLSFALGPKFSIYAEVRYASALGKTMYLPILIGAQIGL